MRTKLLALSAFPLLFSACEWIPVACTTEARPFLVIEVRDAVTGAPAAQGATGEVTDSDYAVALFAGGELYMQPDDWERPGTYDIVVRKAGYQEWRKNDVRVRDGQCHVQTVDVEADLVPLAAS